MDVHQLEKTKQQWQAVADALPQLVGLLDADGRLIHINRTVERWGLGSVISVRGRTPHDVLHPDCTDPACYFSHFWQHVMRELAQGRRSEHCAHDPILKRYVTVRAQPLQSSAVPNPEIGALYAMVVVDDISDLQQAEAAARSRLHALEDQVVSEAAGRMRSEVMQARLLSILEKTTDYVAMADASGDMLYLNPAGRALLGLGDDADISHLKLCKYSNCDAPDSINHEAMISALKDGVWAGEASLFAQNGDEIHASQVIIAHRDTNGELGSLSTILRDISERVRAAQALQDLYEERQCLSSQLVTIQENERRRIALDLHDGLGQSLSLIKHAVENASGLVQAGAADAAVVALDQLVPRIKEALMEVRRVCTDLRPSLLDDLGILLTLSWFFREFEAGCPQIHVKKSIHVVEHDVPASLHITLYRILQEATHNILEHAHASQVRVVLQRNGDLLQLQIEDNGDGFEPDNFVLADGQRRGLGLLSMRERATLSGGVYRLQSSPGRGTRIEIDWRIV